MGARPLEAAAEGGAREVVETLLPLTPPPPGWAGEWSAVAVMDAAQGAPAPAPPPPPAPHTPVRCRLKPATPAIVRRRCTRGTSLRVR